MENMEAITQCDHDDITEWLRQAARPYFCLLSSVCTLQEMTPPGVHIS